MLSRGHLALLSFAALGAGAAVSLVLVAACSSVPETNFGNPSGLSRDRIPGEGGIEALVCTGAGTGTDGGGGGGGGGDGGACGVSFARDIFPNMKAEGAWKCADGKCHGGTQAPKIDISSGATAYTSLKDWMIPGSATPYINTDAGGDPTKSTIECNLLSQCGQGMPESPGRALTHDEICVIDAWLRCGAPNN